MDRHPCQGCGKLFSAEADHCPHCGAATPTPPSEYVFRGMLGLGCLIVLSVVAFGAFAVYYIAH